MSWRDQQYEPGRGEMSSYFANPASLLQLSLPLYRSASLSIRVHFWFLVVAVFKIAEVLRFKEPLYNIPLDLGLLLAAVLFHELGHRVFARRVGGDHADWIVWPLGGMVPPSSPGGAWPTFIANIGGIAFSLALTILAFGAVLLLPNHAFACHFSIDPFGPLVFLTGPQNSIPLTILAHALSVLITTCVAIVVINLFPAYWFDGGYIWQSILTPRLGLWKATLITCLASMILAVPFIALSLFDQNFLGLVVWALIFADGFRRRRALVAAGPGVLDEEENSYQYLAPENPRRKQNKKRWSDAARKRAKMEQAEQALIDVILSKVKEKGLHSLTWSEKRALRKATARQRERDLATRR